MAAVAGGSSRCPIDLAARLLLRRLRCHQDCSGAPLLPWLQKTLPLATGSPEARTPRAGWRRAPRGRRSREAARLAPERTGPCRVSVLDHATLRATMAVLPWRCPSVHLLSHGLVGSNALVLAPPFSPPLACSPLSALLPSPGPHFRPHTPSAGHGHGPWPLQPTLDTLDGSTSKGRQGLRASGFTGFRVRGGGPGLPTCGSLNRMRGPKGWKDV